MQLLITAAIILLMCTVQKTESLPFNYYETTIRNYGCMEKLIRELKLDEKFRFKVEQYWIDLNLQQLIDTILTEMEAICTVEETDAIQVRLLKYKNYLDILYDWILESKKDERIYIRDKLETGDSFSLYKYAAQKSLYMLLQPKYASRLLKSLLLSLIDGIRSSK